MNAFKLGLLSASAMLILLAADASPAVIVKYSVNGGAFQTIADGDALDADSGAGSVSANLTGLGSFAVSGPSTTANGNNNNNTSTLPFQLHLTLSGAVAATPAGSINIYVTSTDFDPIGLPADLKFVSDLGISANPGSLRYRSFLDLNNDAFGEDVLLGDITRTTTGAAAGYTNELIQTITGPFSLTEQFEWSWGASTSRRGIMAVGTIDVTNVPEPAALALFGAGLLGLGLARRRKAA